MRKLLIIVTMLMLSIPAFAAGDTNNPGYFESPGFIGLGGSKVSNRSSMKRDETIAPYLFGVYNLYQSEYGNVGLLAGMGYSRPREEYSSGLKIKSNMFSGDIGIGYFTGAKTINFFLGVGYSYAYLDGKISSSVAGYSESAGESTHGFFYFLGMEYMLTKNGTWGLMFIMNGREYRTNQFDYNDGVISGTANSNVSNQVYSFGLTYHF